VSARTAPSLSEAGFQALVVQLAETCGWRVMHVRRSRVRGGKVATSTSIDGWPDLTIFGHGRLIFAELKSERGQLAAEQRRVLDELRRAGQDVRVWRPGDWIEVEETLTRGRRR